jgi:sporulation protein YlmC with PRC-barrel domain
MLAATKRARGVYTILVKKSILGAKVVNAEREDLGKIEDLVIDTTDNRVAYAILSFGGFLGVGDTHFAIPWEALSFDVTENIAVLKIDKERLANAPGCDPNNWADLTESMWGIQIHKHYGLRPYWEEKRPRNYPHGADPNETL